MKKQNDLKQRKEEQIKIALENNFCSGSTAGFDKYQLIHQALPEIDFNQIDLTTSFLGKKLKAPLLISAMTGGTKKGGEINRNLAKACQKKGIALALGSERILLENKKDKEVLVSFQVRDIAPNILLLANLGAVQLNYGFSLKEAQEAVSLIQADALVLHLNPLQEAMQNKRNTNFKGLTEKIKNLKQKLQYPLIIKEVGNGISLETAKKLKQAGINIVETAGSGGTSWGYLEAKREKKERLAFVFKHWGVNTTDSVINCCQEKLTTIASGGIKDGVEVAKALALGASLCGIALPFLAEAVKSSQKVEEKIDEIILELKIAMFCSGISTIGQLQNTKKLLRVLKD